MPWPGCDRGSETEQDGEEAVEDSEEGDAVGPVVSPRSLGVGAVGAAYRVGFEEGDNERSSDGVYDEEEAPPSPRLRQSNIAF